MERIDVLSKATSRRSSCILAIVIFIDCAVVGFPQALYRGWVADDRVTFVSGNGCTTTTTSTEISFQSVGVWICNIPSAPICACNFIVSISVLTDSYNFISRRVLIFKY
jgi:hypothetical protein